MHVCLQKKKRKEGTERGRRILKNLLPWPDCCVRYPIRWVTPMRGERVVLHFDLLRIVSVLFLFVPVTQPKNQPS